MTFCVCSVVCVCCAPCVFDLICRLRLFTFLYLTKEKERKKTDLDAEANAVPQNSTVGTCGSRSEERVRHGVPNWLSFRHPIYGTQRRVFFFCSSHLLLSSLFLQWCIGPEVLQTSARGIFRDFCQMISKNVLESSCFVTVLQHDCKSMLLTFLLQIVHGTANRNWNRNQHRIQNRLPAALMPNLFQKDSLEIRASTTHNSYSYTCASVFCIISMSMFNQDRVKYWLSKDML